MAGFRKVFPLQALCNLSTVLFSRLRTPISFQPHNQTKLSSAYVSRSIFEKHPIRQGSEVVSNKTLVFDVEGALLKSDSLFPYFMLVAFEAGGLLRALILLLLYPLVFSVGIDLGLTIMVFVSFVGVRKDRFQIGTSVLPKVFLEDVGDEAFEVVRSYGRRIGVSELPRVMVEGFLKDYLGVEAVVVRELKVVCGYYVGLMEEKSVSWANLKGPLASEKFGTPAVGFGCFNKSLHWQLSSHCKEFYRVTKAEKRNWQILPRERYPKPLIFHDGRLAFRPTPFDTLAMFMWLPLGFVLAIFRITMGVLLPFEITSMIHTFTGAQIIISKTKPSGKKKASLYVCNHKTLLDPIYISLGLKKPITAVTYSMSRFNELISPVRTVRLTRDRERDRKLMENVLSQGDLVVCPEGTTCREPYLLRFSPLFAEMADEIVPVAISVESSMFYGSTASGLKCIDPLFHYMNPRPKYHVKFLEKLTGSNTTQTNEARKYEIANHAQNVIAKALGFECTSLTRKDKYMILAGNDGII